MYDLNTITLALAGFMTFLFIYQIYKIIAAITNLPQYDERIPSTGWRSPTNGRIISKKVPILKYQQLRLEL